MCGLYGFIGTPSVETQKILTDLANANEKRGSDSSGISFFDQGQIKTIKDVVISTEFTKRERVQTAFLSSLVIGHTRQATHGDVTVQNAHPFSYGSWVFAHNGVISNSKILESARGLNYEVDSRIIGPLLPNKLHLLQGSYAVVAINRDKPDAIYFWRKYSPLSVACAAGGSFVSSVEWDLNKSCSGYETVKLPNYSHGIILPGRVSFSVDVEPISLHIPEINFLDLKGGRNAPSYTLTKTYLAERVAGFGKSGDSEQRLVS